MRELGDVDRSDTLTAWMAQYVAELMELAANTGPDERVSAHERCADAILRLWAHRGQFAREARPFMDVTEISAVLERINPENTDPFYQHRAHGVGEPRNSDLRKVLQTIEAADRMARGFIEDGVRLAVRMADERDSKWVGAVQGNSTLDTPEARSLSRMLEFTGQAELRDRVRSKLEARLADLTRVETLVDAIRTDLEIRLAEISDQDDSLGADDRM